MWYELRHAEGEASLALTFNGQRIDCHTQIDRDRRAVDPGMPVFNRDIHGAGHSGIERLMTRDADSVIPANRAAPPGALFFHQCQCGEKFRSVRLEELTSVGDRIH